MLVTEKSSGTKYHVHDIVYNKAGYPQFLIYTEGQWVRRSAMKVCMICGRVGGIDYDRYDLVEMHGMPYRIHEREIRDEESLEKWYVDDYFDKFAKKVEEA